MSVRCFVIGTNVLAPRIKKKGKLRVDELAKSDRKRIKQIKQ